MLQDDVSVASPGQYVPPFKGAGFVQVLVLVLVPPPHSALHEE